MNFCILMGSPRPEGNTAELLKPFVATLKKEDCAVSSIRLADKSILPCKGCYACQQVQDCYGCPQNDDMEEIVTQVLQSDCLVLATPIYTWYCTPAMKAVLDRFFGLNKFYGSAKGSLWAGKKVAIITTHGYEASYAAEPFETGVKRLCTHAGLSYLGMYSVRDEDNLASFQTPAAIKGARAFARALLNQ